MEKTNTASVVSHRPASLTTPLWVISLFVSVTESAMVIAATQTTGTLQIAFTVFAMAFAFLVSIIFFLILWFRPWVFYPPESYSHGGTTPAEYVKAMVMKGGVSKEVIKVIAQAQRGS